jgi:hypothetical protein
MAHALIDERRDPPRYIAFLGFDLDNLRPIIAKYLRGERAEANGRQIENFYTV